MYKYILYIVKVGTIIVVPRILAPAMVNVNWRATDQRVYNYLKQRRRCKGITTVDVRPSWWVWRAGAQRDVISSGYRKGLTNSVHNFSRELIAKGLKPLANYLCRRPIPTNSRHNAEWHGVLGGEYRFFASQIYYLRDRRMSLPRERTVDRQIADNGTIHYSDINIAVGTYSFARV